MNGAIHINETWLKKPLLDIETTLQDMWRDDSCDEKPSTSPQLCIDHFSLEELHNVMSRNRAQLGAGHV